MRDVALARSIRLIAVLLVFMAVAGGAMAQEIVRDCARCPEVVAIPAGQLERVGAPSVAVGPFYLGRTEVTFDEWQACVDAGRCRGGQSDHGWGRGNRPIINVSSADVDTYLRWLSGITGQRYRLPTEDEWEWAAKGSASTVFPWGDEAGEGNANCRKCGTQWSGTSSAPVASFAPNGFGLYDVVGNVWEWTADCWHEDRQTRPVDRDCRSRVMKGGAWYYIPAQARPAARGRNGHEASSYTVGFRVLRERQ